MRAAVKWVVGVMAMLLSAGVAAADIHPLHLKNRFPLHLLFLTPRPCAAQTPGQGEGRATLAVDYSPVYFSHVSPDWNFLIDMEMTTADLSITYGLAPRLALKADLPFVSMNAGFLDRYLEAYHDALGVANYGREERPDNSFAYHVSRRGQVWIEGESAAFEMADLTLSAQWQLRRRGERQPWAAALILSLKVPSGDTDKGVGSGRYDYGLYLNADRRGERWSCFLMSGVALNNDPETRAAPVKARPSYSLFAGLGYRYSQKTTWLLQVNSYTSPIEETGISEVDTAAVELALGFHYRAAENWSVEFAFGEDLTRAAPDFTVRLGAVYRFRLGRQ